jgi:hypothetical protein
LMIHQNCSTSSYFIVHAILDSWYTYITMIRCISGQVCLV